MVAYSTPPCLGQSKTVGEHSGLQGGKISALRVRDTVTVSERFLSIYFDQVYGLRDKEVEPRVSAAVARAVVDNVAHERGVLHVVDRRYESIKISCVYCRGLCLV